MTVLQILLQIISLASEVAASNSTGVVAGDAAVAEALVKIVQAAQAAYAAHTGQAIDPTLIAPEASL